MVTAGLSMGHINVREGAPYLSGLTEYRCWTKQSPFLTLSPFGRRFLQFGKGCSVL